MAELPEVEVYVRNMQRTIVGRTITEGVVPVPQTVRFVTPEEFSREIAGAQIEGVSRRAKWMLLALSGDRVLALHLMLFGSLRLERESEPREPELSLALRLDDGSELRLLDKKGYARAALLPASGLDERLHLDQLGPEVLDVAFTPDALERRFSRKRTPVKPALLDQHIVAGMGNRDADESLWRARIDPRKPAGAMTHDEAERLTAAMRDVLREGIDHGGTMGGLSGQPGTQRKHIQVFARQGKPCPRCGAPIQRQLLQNRNTFFCPVCQQSEQAETSR
ncbi:MAG: bifunctional DNA-formamidopyrimidine glycosylase/DNA-(apurinic or apyrimidinic site) lyase [Ktedonobacterales bacterium]